MKSRTVTIKSSGLIKGEKVNAFRQRLSLIASLSNYSRNYGWIGLPSYIEDAKEIASLQGSAVVENVIVKPSRHGWAFVSFKFRNGDQIQRTIRVKVLTIDGQETEHKNPLAWFLASISDRSEIVLEIDTTDNR